MDKKELFTEILSAFLSSTDYNGLPVYNLESDDEKTLTQNIISLIEEDKIELHRGDSHQNPHIKAFEVESKKEQIKKIEQNGLEGCLYPTQAYLGLHVKKTDEMNNSPFSTMLKLGEPQLSFKAFDLSILEQYRNDPKYFYETDDILGTISVTGEYYDSVEMQEKDKVFLQTFGYCYDKEMNRAVAVFLRYLADLSPEHQRIWHAKLLDNKFKLHPDYYRPSILGEFPERVSIFDAFLEEQKILNDMAKILGKANLFKNTNYKAYNRPRHFGFLIRPTLKEYSDFVHLLDKLISENINPDFFVPDIVIEEEVTRHDGTKEKRRKPSVQLLEKWLERVKFPDPEPKDEMLKTFREIRRLRQRPAHTLDDDKFDQQYFKEQRDLIKKSYNAMRTLHLIFANHPKLKKVNIPDWLYKGKICTY